MIYAHVRTTLEYSDGGEPMSPRAFRPHLSTVLKVSARVRMGSLVKGAKVGDEIIAECWLEDIKSVTELDGYEDAVIESKEVEDPKIAIQAAYDRKRALERIRTSKPPLIYDPDGNK